MRVGGIGRVMHDANVHRLSNRYSNRLSCVVIDEARRTFEQNIHWVLLDIELAKRLQRVVAAAPHPHGETQDPPPPPPTTLRPRPQPTPPPPTKHSTPPRHLT